MGRQGTKEYEDSELVRFQWEGGEQKSTKTVSWYDSNGKVGNKKHEDSELVQFQWEGGEQNSMKTVSWYDPNGKVGNNGARRQ